MLSVAVMLHREVFAVIFCPWEGLRKFAMAEIAGHIRRGPERPETDEMSHHTSGSECVSYHLGCSAETTFSEGSLAVQFARRAYARNTIQTTH